MCSPKGPGLKQAKFAASQEAVVSWLPRQEHPLFLSLTMPETVGRPGHFSNTPGITVVIGEPIATTDKSANELTEQAEQWIRQQFKDGPA